MQPRDLGLIATAGEVQVSPDGRRVIYALTTVDLEANAYRTRLWLVAGSGDERPLPLTAGTKADVLPRWSPDGRMVAWVSTRHPEPAIYLLAVDGPGEPVLVTSWADEISELAWSPTGDRLVFVARVRDPARYGAPGTTTPEADMPPRRVTRLNSQHNGDGWVFDRRPQVHVVPVDGSSPPQQITDIEAGASGVAWSPDGTRLAYVAATHARWDLDGCNDVWVVDAAGGEASRLTDTAMSWSYPAWSPDGSRIAALAVPTPESGPRHGQLWVIDATSGAAERLVPSFDRNLMPYGAARPPLWIGDEVMGAVCTWWRPAPPGPVSWWVASGWSGPTTPPAAPWPSWPAP
jgi:Tol biopolymer transport system component